MKRRKKWLLLAAACLLLTSGCGNAAQDPAPDGETVQSGAAMAGAETASVVESETETFTPGPLNEEQLVRYTDFLNSVENNGFLCSSYQTVLEADLNEIFYNGAGIAEAVPEEVREAYAAQYGPIETDVIFLTAAQIDTFLMEKTGHSMAEFEKPLDWPYLEENLTYASQHGDTNMLPVQCIKGTVKEDGTIVLDCAAEDAGEDSWISACHVVLQEADGKLRFIRNTVTDGMYLEYKDLPEETQGVAAEQEGVIRAVSGDIFLELPATQQDWQEFLFSMDSSADASAVSGFNQWGDWTRITKEALYGTWYEPGEDGNGVVLVLDAQGAYVWYPLLDEYGDKRYDWQITDRSESGLCPSLQILWEGGPLTYYIAGVTEGYFWCNSQQDIFYKQ